MNETDIRERSIDSGAAFLLAGSPDRTPEQWRQAAANARLWSAQDAYQRCAEIAEARQALANL